MSNTLEEITTKRQNPIENCNNTSNQPVEFYNMPSDYSKMQISIFECMAAMYFDQNRSFCKDSFQESQWRVFWRTVSEMALEIGNLSSEDEDKENLSPALSIVLSTFTKTRIDTDAKEWLPLYCAVACTLTEEKDIQLIGTGLQLSVNRGACLNSNSQITPWHVAAAVREPNMKIIRSLKPFCLRMGRCEDANHWLPIHYAARYSGSIAMIQELLQAFPAGISRQTSDGSSALHLVCLNSSSNSLDMLKLLLEANPSAAQVSDNSGELPLHKVIDNHRRSSHQQMAMMAALLAAFPAGAGIPTNASRRTPVHLVCRGTSEQTPHMLQILLSAHPTAASAQDAAGCLPLHDVISSYDRWPAPQRIAMITALLEAFPEGVAVPNDSSWTAVQLICSESSPEAPDILSLLLAQCSHGASIRDAEGRSPLHDVIARADLTSQQRQRMVAALLKAHPESAGAVAVSGGLTPVHTVCLEHYEGAADVLEQLLDACPSAAAQRSSDGTLPLHIACSSPVGTSLLPPLLRVFPAGAGALDGHGVTPLHYAVKNGIDLSLIEQLVLSFPQALTVECDYRSLLVYGTPLHVAANGSDVPMLQLLYRHGREAARAVSDGWTPLHYAAYSDTADCAMLRAVYDIDPSAIRALTNERETPLYLLMLQRLAQIAPPSPVSNSSDKLRFLLSKYPEAVSVENVEGKSALSVCDEEDHYTHRLLLIAVPCLHNDILRQFTYMARRMGLFLFFVGLRGDGKFTNFVKFYESCKDVSLVRRIVEFL